MNEFLEGLLSPTFNGADLWGAALLVGLTIWWMSPPAETTPEDTDE